MYFLNAAFPMRQGIRCVQIGNVSMKLVLVKIVLTLALGGFIVLLSASSQPALVIKPLSEKKVANLPVGASFGELKTSQSSIKRNLQTERGAWLRSRPAKSGRLLLDHQVIQLRDTQKFAT